MRVLSRRGSIPEPPDFPVVPAGDEAAGRGKTPKGLTYAAFISYSHAVDGKLAPALQAGLQRFAKPWWRIRALRVFRDDANLMANPGLWSSIQEGLTQSEYFILLASWKAANSKWVRHEAEYWLDHKSPDKILIVLTDTEVDQAGRIDWAKTKVTCLPPGLGGAVREEPRFVDLHWARREEHLSSRDPRFRECLADLAARLHDQPKDDLIGEDVRLHRRAIRLVRAAVTIVVTLALLASVAAFVAIRQREAALLQLRVATSRRLAVLASALLDQRPEAALLVALEGLRAARTEEAVAVLQEGLSRPRHIVTEFIGHEDWVRAVAFSPDGRILASADSKGTIRLWDVRTRQALGQPLFGHEGSEVRGLAFSPDGRMLASAGGRIVQLWDVETHQRLGQLLRHGFAAYYGLAFNADGRILATADYAGLSLWDVRTRQELGQPLRGHKDFVRTVAFSPDGRTLASAGSDETVRLWDMRTRQALGQPLRGRLVLGVAFSPDGGTLASADSADGTVRLWNVRTRRALGALRGHEGAVNAVAFSPDGKTLASGSANHTVRLWDERTRRGLGEPVRGAAFSPVAFGRDGEILASDSPHYTVRFWSVRTRQELRGSAKSR